jgi:hypothetical protein
MRTSILDRVLGNAAIALLFVSAMIVVVANRRVRANSLQHHRAGSV